MHVAGGAHGLAELVAQAQHAAVEVLQALFVRDLAVADHEGVVARGLDFEVVVEGGDALDLPLALALDHGADELARLARGADDEPLAPRLELGLEDVRPPVEVLEVRVGHEAVEVLQARPVLGPAG